MNKETDKAVNDPNYLAYTEFNSKGVFADLEPGTFVAFINGIFIGSGASYEELGQLDQVKNSQTGVFVHQVNVPETIYDIPSVLSID